MPDACHECWPFTDEQPLAVSRAKLTMRPAAGATGAVRRFDTSDRVPGAILTCL